MLTRRTSYLIGSVVVTLGIARPALGQDPVPPPKSPPPEERPHAVYVEALGKGGLWGVGYDFVPPVAGGRLVAGAAGSYSVMDDMSIVQASPYIGVSPYLSGQKRWFIHGGPTFVRSNTQSPVPEWSGVTESGVGAELGSGYEVRGPVLFRAYAMATVGKGGIVPWLGMGFGKTF